MPWHTGLRNLAADPGLAFIAAAAVATLAAGSWHLTRRFLQQRGIRPRMLLPQLAVLFAIGLFAYLQPGDILDGDAHSHVARTWLFHDIVGSEHTFPIWTNRWYFGGPLGLHYGFAYYALSAAAMFVTGLDVFTSTKICLLLLHVASGLALFALARRLTGSPAAALFAALFFVFSPQHTGGIQLSGALPLGLTYLLLPLLFLLIESNESARRSKLTAGIGIGSMLGLALFTHLQQGWFAALMVFIVLGTRAIVAGVSGERSESARQVAVLGVGAGALFLLAGWYLIPLVGESRMLVVSRSAMSEELLGTPSMARLREAETLLLWSRLKLHWVYYYVGLVPLSLALIGLLARQKGNDIRRMSYRVAGAIGIVFTLLNTRFTHVQLFLLAVLAAYGFRALEERLSGRLASLQRYLALLPVLLTLDIGPTLAQRPYLRIDNTRLAAIQKKVEADGTSGRILVLTRDRSTLWRSLDVIATGVSSPFGGNPQNSTLTHPHAVAIASQAAAEFLDRRAPLSSETRDALRLLNVQSVWVPELDTVLTIAAASPAWFAAQTAASACGEDRLERHDWARLREIYETREIERPISACIVKEMQLDPASPRAGRILLHNPTIAALENRSRSLDLSDTACEFAVSSCVETHSCFDLRYRCSAPGFLQLAYSYFPYNRIELDGRQIRGYPSAMNFLVVPTPAGDHRLIVSAGISPLRRWLALLGLGSFGFICSPAIARTQIKRSSG